MMTRVVGRRTDDGEAMGRHRYIYDWNVRGRSDRRTRPVLLWDETLRDGLQGASVRNPSIDEKVEILRLMDRLGIQFADIGLPGAGPSHREHMDGMLAAIAARRLSVRPACAVRAVVDEIEPVVAMQERHGLPIVVSVFLGASPIRHYVEGWDLSRMLGMMDRSITFAVSHGLGVMFVTEDTTRSRPEVVRTLYRRAIDLGARAVCVADTVGHATPRGVRRLLRFVRRVVDEAGVDDVLVHWHGHRDRGLCVANCLAAIEAGVDVLHGTAIGIGERSGNAPMDQLLVNLVLMGLHGHDVSALGEYCRVVSTAVGISIPENYPVVGADAFRTQTGVHAAAIVKALAKGDLWLADRVYSSVPATSFGREQVLCVGPMSGRANVLHWLERRGVAPSDELVARILARAKASERVLTDEEIAAVVSGDGAV